MRCHDLLLLCIHLGTAIIPIEQLSASFPVALSAILLFCRHLPRCFLALSLTKAFHFTFPVISYRFWQLVAQLMSDAKGCSNWSTVFQSVAKIYAWITGKKHTYIMCWHVPSSTADNTCVLKLCCVIVLQFLSIVTVLRLFKWLLLLFHMNPNWNDF